MPPRCRAVDEEIYRKFEEMLGSAMSAFSDPKEKVPRALIKGKNRVRPDRYASAHAFHMLHICT
jgi:hypothetical protein